LDEKEIGYYNFEKYSLISKFCRKNKKHRGSCIYAKTKLEAKPYNLFDDLNQEEHFEASIIELIRCSIIIICVYRTPNNKGLWEYNLEVIETGFSDNNTQILQVQMQHKNKKRAECRMARSYREENVQYLNYLLDKETWELLFKQKLANDAYNGFLGIFQYYYEIAIPKKLVKSKQHENKWVTSGIRK
jgi:hypothetical protein